MLGSEKVYESYRGALDTDCLILSRCLRQPETSKTCYKGHFWDMDISTSAWRNSLRLVGNKLSMFGSVVSLYLREGPIVPSTTYFWHFWAFETLNFKHSNNILIVYLWYYFFDILDTLCRYFDPRYWFCSNHSATHSPQNHLTSGVLVIFYGFDLRET